MQAEQIKGLAAGSASREVLWVDFLRAVDARSVAEIGVYRGAFAQRVLDACEQIESYYVIDPWRHLDDWNKPANTTDDAFERFYTEAMTRTEAHADKRRVLRGKTVEVIDEIPDGSLDLAYIDGDHTLRASTPAVRPPEGHHRLRVHRPHRALHPPRPQKPARRADGAGSAGTERAGAGTRAGRGAAVRARRARRRRLSRRPPRSARPRAPRPARHGEGRSNSRQLSGPTPGHGNCCSPTGR